MEQQGSSVAVVAIAVVSAIVPIVVQRAMRWLMTSKDGDVFRPQFADDCSGRLRRLHIAMELGEAVVAFGIPLLGIITIVRHGTTLQANGIRIGAFLSFTLGIMCTLGLSIPWILLRVFRGGADFADYVQYANALFPNKLRLIYGAATISGIAFFVLAAYLQYR